MLLTTRADRKRGLNQSGTAMQILSTATLQAQVAALEAEGAAEQSPADEGGGGTHASAGFGSSVALHHRSATLCQTH